VVEVGHLIRETCLISFFVPSFLDLEERWMF